MVSEISNMKYDAARKKMLRIFVTVLLCVTVLLLISVSFFSRFDYTPFKAFAVEIIPSKTYKITYDLPHLSKGITAKQREKAENNVSKTFRIPLSSLKQNEYLSKPLVYITYIPFPKKYEGFVKIGNIVSKFDKIKALQGNRTGDSNNQSDILLTGYFTLNNIPLRANIFIMNNGSVLRYSSMTIQDQNDNVLAMFTYGKLVKGDNTVSKSGEKTKTGKISKAFRDEDSFNWVRRGNSIKYISITDPFTGTVSCVPAIRQDVLAKYPFVAPNERLGVKVRTWAFQNDIVNVYKNFYTRQYGSGWASVGAYDMENSYKFEFPSDLLNCGFYPEEKDFNDNTLLSSNIAFNLINSLTPCLRISPINFSVNAEGGYEIKWNFGNNCAYVSAKAKYPVSEDTFSYNWNDSVAWPGSDYEANYLENPGSSYKGFVSKILFLLAGNPNSYYGDFSGHSHYVIEVGSGAEYDIYYLKCSTYERYVNLTR